MLGDAACPYTWDSGPSPSGCSGYPSRTSECRVAGISSTRVHHRHVKAHEVRSQDTFSMGSGPDNLTARPVSAPDGQRTDPARLTIAAGSRSTQREVVMLGQMNVSGVQPHHFDMQRKGKDSIYKPARSDPVTHSTPEPQDMPAAATKVCAFDKPPSAMHVLENEKRLPFCARRPSQFNHRTGNPQLQSQETFRALQTEDMPRSPSTTIDNDDASIVTPSEVQSWRPEMNADSSNVAQEFLNTKMKNDGGYSANSVASFGSRSSFTAASRQSHDPKPRWR